MALKCVRFRTLSGRFRTSQRCTGRGQEQTEPWCMFASCLVDGWRLPYAVSDAPSLVLGCSVSHSCRGRRMAGRRSGIGHRRFVVARRGPESRIADAGSLHNGRMHRPPRESGVFDSRGDRFGNHYRRTDPRPGWSSEIMRIRTGHALHDPSRATDRRSSGSPS